MIMNNSGFDRVGFGARFRCAVLWMVLAAALGCSIPAGLAASKKPVRMAPKIPPGKPEIFELDPRGIQRGVPVRIRLVGTNLVGLTELEFHDPGVNGELMEEPAATTNEAWIEITANADLPRGGYEISVKNTNSESSRLKVYVDDLPQVYEGTNNGGRPKLSWPVSFWGTLDPAGDSDELEFEARAGQSLVFDVAAKAIGSQANVMMSLFDPAGGLVAANAGFDGGDPLMGFQVPVSGRYRLRLGERTDAGSKEHFYRVSIGSFPVAVGAFPLAIQIGQSNAVELIGLNLPAEGRKTMLKPTALGELQLPVDPEKSRLRRPLKIMVTEGPERMETEPNDLPAEAMGLAIPAAINGRIWPRAGGSNDVDLFRFSARRGQTLVVETEAARRGSPLDTRIEILHPDGRPVERLVLQAVRDSHVTFRGIDSNTDDLRVENWQEMELNQYMYLQGEVCRIFRMPQGPDSGFQFYSFKGKRRDYFGTSPVAHALDELAYIVEPHPPGDRLVASGLPVFTLDYQNDDDGDRELGTDSRLLFTPPDNGDYLVRVSDARGYGGDRFVYRLVVREARPDFKVTLSGVDPTIEAGVGKEFTVSVDRIDGFDGDVKVEIAGVPSGFRAASPVVIQAGHLEARGTLNADADALAPGSNNVTRVTASAVIAGREVTREVNSFGQIKLGEKPKLFVALEPYDAAATNFVERSVTNQPLEITIAPGQTIPAWLKLKRNGHQDLVTFTIEGLPHGVIVDNIGLNGVLIPKEQDQRQIFLTAARWVPETDRLCFAQAKQAGNPTSLPVLLHVRKRDGELSKSAPAGAPQAD